MWFSMYGREPNNTNNVGLFEALENINSVSAAIARGKRPVTFRTRKLRLSAPMVLRGRPRGRVGHRRTYFEKGPPASGGHSSMNVRRCPTLPQGLPCSTIGAASLSFRVRNVSGRFPRAMAAETRATPTCPHRVGLGVWSRHQPAAGTGVTGVGGVKSVLN